MKVNVVEVKAQRKVAMESIKRFSSDILNRNKNQIAFTIKNRGINESPVELIEYFIDYILSETYSGYEKDQLLLLISSGVLFKIRLQIIEDILNDETIKKAIDKDLVCC